MIKHASKIFHLTFDEMGDHVSNLKICKQNEKKEMYKMSEIKEMNSALVKMTIVSNLNEEVEKIEVI